MSGNHVETRRGRLSQESLDARYASIDSVGFDETALVEAISNPETAANAAVLGVASSLVPGGLISVVDAMANLAVPRPVNAVSVMWLVPTGTAEAVNFRTGDFYARITETVLKWNPSKLPNVVGWWDVQDLTAVDGALVQQLNDLSGKGRHMIQATTAAQPVYRSAGLNGHPALQFDGTDDILAANFVDASLLGSTWTLYLVGQDTRSSATSSKFFVDGFTTVQQRLAFSRSATNTFVMQRGTAFTAPPVADANIHRFKVVFNGATSSLTIDSGSAISGTTGSTPTEVFTRFTIGGRADLASFLQGFIGSVCIVQGLVSPTDDEKMSTYLKDRWGVS